MSAPGITATTRNAITTSHRTLLLNHHKYLPPNNMANEYPREDALKMCYRRLIRLKPLISQRDMVRMTYVQYLRYKFMTEDYSKKVSTSSISLSGLETDVVRQVENSLYFCLKSASEVKKRVLGEDAVSRRRAERMP
ncbi:LANO_0G00210g1_1 [Lachancea nothofagi CBS 11611]|uniref:LANO_0G00210g1_1 n=1 Tax=Lachancea nothofagi CBS 11611 TaxID=1266666 RepID=A0A1G4KE52_9SACH|nr:LANO_0G00210g1_1 [Lachancea nothofagi CBS 11611]